jgi:hypothetical protein
MSIELNPSDRLNPVHQAQILAYLKFAHKSLGLRINYHVTLYLKWIEKI